MPCERSMDAPSPGDWTVRVLRGPDGSVEAVSVGSWLARDVRFRAV
jgi:D-aminopeptidase